MNAHGLEGFNQDLRKCEGKLLFTHPLWYLFVLNFAIWRDRVSRGFMFAIPIGNYEKRTWNFATQAFSINYILFFKKSKLMKISRLSGTSETHIKDSVLVDSLPHMWKNICHTKWNFPVELVNNLEDVHFKDVTSSNVPNNFDDDCSLFAFLRSMSRPPYFHALWRGLGKN